MTKGDVDTRRMSVTTLDRYLQRIGQPQVFGSQFNSSDLTDPAKWTLEPYQTNLVSDALRKTYCVESLATQQEIILSLQNGDELKEHTQRSCSD